MNRGRLQRMTSLLIAVTLTAKLGTIQFNGHAETWYNLRMDKVVTRADKTFGITDLYWVRGDGVKMYGPWVICAADWNVHPQYTLVETSLGTGIVLDAHTANDSELIDIAVVW